MNKIKREKSKDYTTISNVFLRDDRMSLKAKGFLAVVMGLPDDWDFSINGMCTILKEGRDAIYSTIKELKELGYCNVENLRNDEGRIAGNDYTFTEIPYTEKPHTENPDTDKPTQLNIYRINNEIEPIKQEYIAPIKPKLKSFKKPSVEEIKAYCEERDNKVDAERFFDFYESKGWMVGRNKMKDWKAAVRNWERDNKRESSAKERRDRITQADLHVNDEWAGWDEAVRRD